MVPSSLFKKVLRTLRKPALTDHRVAAAQRRGWEEISHLLNDSSMITSVPSWHFGKVLPLARIFLIIVVVSGITGGGYYSYLRQNTNSVKPNPTPPSGDVQARAAFRFKELAGVSLDQFKVAAAKADGTEVPVYYSERLLTSVGDESNVIPYIARYFAPQPAEESIRLFNTVSLLP